MAPDSAWLAWLLVAGAIGLGAGWSLGRSHAIRLCRRIARAGLPGVLDRVFVEDALLDTRFRDSTGPAEVRELHRREGER